MLFYILDRWKFKILDREERERERERESTRTSLHTCQDWPVGDAGLLCGGCTVSKGGEGLLVYVVN
jgi:hypothetical protein